ncbi:MAG TPA: lytic transglycosylase domain-containing protein [Candidatus Binatia bacterium]|jgi:soluble lytic murein transglycosylase-like protein
MSLMLAPSQLSKAGNAHWVERDNKGDRDAVELLKIYSVVKKGMAYAEDGAVWDVSNTVQNESKRHGLDPFLVLAIIKVESGFQHSAEAEDGARGLMQIQPEIAKSIAQERKSVYRSDKHVGADDPDLDDPIVNIKLGVFYLHSLRRNFQDMTLALAAYNRGPTRVKNLLLEETDVPLEYATRVLSTYQDYRRNARRFD